MEIVKKIKGEDYFITSKGRVFRNGRSTKSYRNKTIPKISLMKGDTKKVFDLNRLVYETFISELDKGTVIYFKDGDIDNCEVSNLIVLDKKIKRITIEEFENFNGINSIIAKAKLNKSDLEFIEKYKEANPETMSYAEKLNWERIIYSLIDARRDFLLVDKFSEELENFLKDLMCCEYKKATSSLNINHYKEQPIPRSNFKKRCVLEGWNFDDFTETQNKTNGRLKYFTYSYKF